MSITMCRACDGQGLVYKLDGQQTGCGWCLGAGDIEENPEPSMLHAADPLVWPLLNLTDATRALYESFIPEQKPHDLDGPLEVAEAAIAPYRSPTDPPVSVVFRGDPGLRTSAAALGEKSAGQFCIACNVAWPDAEDDFGIINGYCAACFRDLRDRQEEPGADDSGQDKPRVITSDDALIERLSALALGEANELEDALWEAAWRIQALAEQVQKLREEHPAAQAGKAWIA